MALVVQKFGGSSVATIKRIKNVAKIITETKEKGDDVCVVVSAMGKMTDRLIALAKEVNKNPPARELDMMLTAGERVTAALLAMAVERFGYQAVSFTGSQIGIITDENFTQAKIKRITAERLVKAISENKIPIVMGFQGVSTSKEITTLGRGGSDITAVALAATLKACRCEIYSDVFGVYTEDPKKFRSVKLIKELNYDEMLELAAAGAKVFHPRACALAQKYNLKVVLKSSFNPKKGETVLKSEEWLEQAKVKAITHKTDLVLFALLSVPCAPRCLHQVVSQLAYNKIRLQFFSHGLPFDNKFDLIFILPKDDAKKAFKLLSKIKEEIGGKRLVKKEDLGSISLVGGGIGNEPEILKTLFETLTKKRIHIDAFATAPTRITCFLPSHKLNKTIAVLLKVFGLAK